MDESHGCFLLINRRHRYRWVTVVSWLNYLILAVDQWVSFTQQLVNRAVGPTLDLSALLHIHHAASYGFCWYKFVYIFSRVLRLSNFYFSPNLVGSYSILYHLCFQQISLRELEFVSLKMSIRATIFFLILFYLYEFILLLTINLQLSYCPNIYIYLYRLAPLKFLSFNLI